MLVYPGYIYQQVPPNTLLPAAISNEYTDALIETNTALQDIENQQFKNPGDALFQTKIVSRY